MTIQIFSNIMEKCNYIMNLQITLFGITTDLWNFLLFDLLVALITFGTLKIFSGE